MFETSKIEGKFKEIFFYLLIVLVFVLAYLYLQDNPILEDSLGTIDPTIENVGDNLDDEIVIGGVSNQNNQNIPSGTTSNTNGRANLPKMENGSYLIYYFNDGFYPNVLQVRQGTSVRYVNKSEGAMRVFAEEQNDLKMRELNQPQTVGIGGMYDFTFTQTGVWFYTNYNNKLHKASVVIY